MPNTSFCHFDPTSGLLQISGNTLAASAKEIRPYRLSSKLGIPLPQVEFWLWQGRRVFCIHAQCMSYALLHGCRFIPKKRLMLVRFSDRAVPRIEVFFLLGGARRVSKHALTRANFRPFRWSEFNAIGACPIAGK